MPAVTEVRIKGQAELERAFMQLRRDVLREIKPAILEIAELVRVDAEQKAGTEISNIGSQWARMRAAVIVKGAYVAPKSKRRGGSPRPNLAGLLMDKAMQPALDENKPELERRMALLVAMSSKRAGF